MYKNIKTEGHCLSDANARNVNRIFGRRTKQQGLLKCWLTSTPLQVATTQKRAIFWSKHVAHKILSLVINFCKQQWYVLPVKLFSCVCPLSKFLLKSRRLESRILLLSSGKKLKWTEIISIGPRFGANLRPGPGLAQHIGFLPLFKTA
jgi:hypothetical protein